MPEIRNPQREVSFKEKFVWTAIVLVIYLIMSNIPLYGVDLQESTDYFYWLRVILASQRGTLTELGIGPIVTSGLIMQLLLGSKMINIDMSDPYDRSMFSGTQKVVAIFLTMFNAIAYMLGGAFGPPETLGLENMVLIFLQLMFSGVIIILLDELLQKGWGLGSGVSLFIAAGVSGQIFWNAFSFIEAPGEARLPRGIIIAIFYVLFDDDPDTNIQDLWVRGQLPSILGLVTTIIIFIIIVWFEGTRVEIPLQYKGYRGFKGKYPMKLMYVSNIPVILVNALYANILFFGQIIAGPDSQLRGQGYDFWLDLIGTFTYQSTGEGTGGYLIPSSGLIYILSPPLGMEALIADPLRAVISSDIYISLYFTRESLGRS